jgi:hypothetical protein
MKKTICMLLLVAIGISSSACFFRPSRSQKDKAKNEEETTEKYKDDDEVSKDSEKDKKDDEDATESIDQPQDGVVFEKVFGTFSIPAGWEESEGHSTNKKFFYIPEGNEDKSYTDNISIQVGESKYSEEEAVEFKNAILRQFSTQISEDEYDSMTAEGSSTANGYTLLTFDFKGLKDGTEIVFYYIMGDNKYCEIYLTCKDDPEEAMEVAQMIVDSFVWAKED